MAEEETLSSRTVYEGRAVKLRIDTVRMPNGRETTREIVEHSNCVAIIAVDDADNVLLVNGPRLTPRSWVSPWVRLSAFTNEWWT